MTQVLLSPKGHKLKSLGLCLPSEMLESDRTRVQTPVGPSASKINVFTINPNSYYQIRLVSKWSGLFYKLGLVHFKGIA